MAPHSCGVRRIPIGLAAGGRRLILHNARSLSFSLSLSLSFSLSLSVRLSASLSVSRSFVSMCTIYLINYLPDYLSIYLTIYVCNDACTYVCTYVCTYACACSEWRKRMTSPSHGDQKLTCDWCRFASVKPAALSGPDITVEQSRVCVCVCYCLFLIT